MKKLLDLKRIRLVQRCKPGDRMPAFYGIAWVNIYENSITCMPVPFNLLAALARALWIFMKCGWRRVKVDPHAAYLEGVEDGKRGRGGWL